MGDMPISGGWTMSMMWMRMPGQSWAGTAASFLAAWIVMMMAMMLPSFGPTLWRHRGAMRRAALERANQLTALVALGYFVVWAAIGAIVFPLGVALAELAARQPALASGAPLAVGAVVLLAGILQHSSWKARQLRFCRALPAHHRAPSADARAAWRHGVRLGLHCVASCVGLTAITLVVGMMDVRVMAAITGAITLERLAPSDVRVVRAIGDVAVLAGLVLLARAVGLA